MDVSIIQVPYDSGRRDYRHGKGPGAILASGLICAFEADGHTMRGERVVTVGKDEAGEIAVAFELGREIAAEVAAAREVGAFPIVLAGNCNATVGAVSGTGNRSALGVVWLDAHADFHTPETTESGFLDGMGLATLSGQCWHTLTHVKIPSYAPVAPARVILVGAHAVDAQEAQRLHQAGVTCVEANVIRNRSAGDVPEALKRALKTLSRRGVREVHLHVDMDVHDPASIVANSWSVPGGLTADEVLDVVGVIVGAFKIVGMSVASLDPDVDRADEATQAAVRLLRTVVRSVSEGKSASRRGVADRGAAKRLPDTDVRRAPSGGA